MDFRKKYNKTKEKENKSNQNDKKKVIKDEKIKNSNSYLKKILEKNNNQKVPKTTTINLTSYKENLPCFRINIRDILSTEENKQKALNYVVKKRNEEKYGAKNQFQKNNVVKYKKEKTLNSRYSNYNNNSKILNKNNTLYNSNSTSKFLVKSNTEFSGIKSNLKNQKHNESNESSITDKHPTYTYYYSRKNKPHISPIFTINNINQINQINNDFYKRIEGGKKNNNHNYVNNKSTNKDTGQRRNVIKYNYNANSISPYNNRINKIKINDNKKCFDNTYKKSKRYQIIKNNDKSPFLDISGNIHDKSRFKPIRTYFILSDNKNNNLLFKNENNNKSNNKKSYDILPLNIKESAPVYYSKYSKKNEQKIRVKEININKSKPKNIFQNYTKINFGITKNSFQLNNNNKDNKDKIRVRYGNKVKKNSNLKEKTIEINISGTHININNEIKNLKLINKLQQSTNNSLLFKDINDLASYINKKYNQEKKIELFKIDVNKENKNDELDKMINKNKENEIVIQKLKLNIDEQSKEIIEIKNGSEDKDKIIENLRNSIKDLSIEKDKLMQENQNLKDELNKIRDKKKEEDNKNITKDDFDELTNKFNLISKEKEEIQNEYQKLFQNYNNVIQTNEKIKLEKENNNNELNEKQKELNEILNEKKNLLEENKALINENKKLKEELANLRKENDENKNKLIDKEKYIEEILAQKNIQKLEPDESVSKDEIKEENKKDINEEINKEKIDNENDNIEYLKLKEENEKLKTENKKILKDNKKLKSEKKLLQNEHKALRDDYQKIKEDFTVLKNDYNYLREDYIYNNKQVLEEIRRAKILKRGSRSVKNHDEFGLHMDKMEDYHISNKMVKSKTLLNLNDNNTFSDIIYQMNNNINNENDFNNNIINNENEKSPYLLVNKFNIEEDVNDKENNAGLNNNTLFRSKKRQKSKFEDKNVVQKLQENMLEEDEAHNQKEKIIVEKIEEAGSIMDI